MVGTKCQQPPGLPRWLSGFFKKNLHANGGDTGRGRLNPLVRKNPWRRKWQPTAVFLPGKFHEQRGLVGAVMGLQRVGHN